jgi:hypothetical protein
MKKGLLARFRKPSLTTEAAAPLRVYMDPVEHAQLVAIVEAVAPRRILEWGCGGSTREFCERYPFVEQVVSIEHNAAWAKRVREAITSPRLSLYHEPPTVPEPDMFGDGKVYQAWMKLCEDDPAVLASYVAKPASLGVEFDLVLVDGRARVHCLRQGFALLRTGGVLLIHDAQRTEYHATLHELGRAVFITPFGKGQFCLIRKG